MQNMLEILPNEDCQTEMFWVIYKKGHLPPLIPRGTRMPMVSRNPKSSREDQPVAHRDDSLKGRVVVNIYIIKELKSSWYPALDAEKLRRVTSFKAMNMNTITDGDK